MLKPGKYCGFYSLPDLSDWLAGIIRLLIPVFQAVAEVRGLEHQGLADIAFYNAVGLTVNRIDNREFDNSIDSLAYVLNFENYPFVGVNPDFSHVILQERTPPIEAGADGTLENFLTMVTRVRLHLITLHQL